MNTFTLIVQGKFDNNALITTLSNYYWFENIIFHFWSPTPHEQSLLNEFVKQYPKVKLIYGVDPMVLSPEKIKTHVNFSRSMFALKDVLSLIDTTHIVKVKPVEYFLDLKPMLERASKKFFSCDMYFRKPHINLENGNEVYWGIHPSDHLFCLPAGVFKSMINLGYEWVQLEEAPYLFHGESPENWWAKMFIFANGLYRGYFNHGNVDDYQIPILREWFDVIRCDELGGFVVSDSQNNVNYINNRDYFLEEFDLSNINNYNYE
jgi:hypothetical protein